MKKILILNWKQFPDTKDQADSFMTGFTSFIKKNKLEALVKKHEIVLLPPYIFIDRIMDIEAKNVSIGAQDVSRFNQGAFTGEISSKMLKSLGVKYVLVGHSERRLNFKEKNEDINTKILNCLHYNLKPILCVGENARNKNENSNSFRIKKIVFTQLNECLKGIKEDEIQDVIIAYEPVWAISSSANSKVADVSDVETMLINIRFWFETRFGKDKALNVKILYGGSINKDNILNFKSLFINDGFLVGKASTNLKELGSVLTNLKKL